MHVMPLEKINDAFALIKEGKSIRSVVVVFSSWLLTRSGCSWWRAFFAGDKKLQGLAVPPAAQPVRILDMETKQS